MSKKPATDIETMGLPEALGGEAFREHWLFHLQSRKNWGHKRYAPAGAVAKLTGWSKYPVQAVIDAIRESDEQGWQGTFPDKHAKKYASGGVSEMEMALEAHRRHAEQAVPTTTRGLPHHDF